MNPGERSLQALTVPLSAEVAASECVGPDGALSLWLLRAGSSSYACGCDACVPPHEHTGSLPVELRDRLGRA